MSDSDKPAPTMSLGQAIDRLIESLNPLDAAARATALRTACDHLSIPLLSKGIQGIQPESKTVAAETPTALPTTPIDIRQLKEQKSPGTANEMAALVAYYLSEIAPEEDRKKEVDFKDMQNYFKKARYPLPKATQQLLPNARNAGYFDPLGQGRFRLNAVGYNLVAHNLPHSGEARISASTSRRRRKVNRKRTARKTRRAKKS
jgi:hypothetical protein